VIVIDQRTSTGMMAEPNGHFVMNALRGDTILVTASGFSVRKVCFKDSGVRGEYSIVVRLDSMHYSLAEVKVYPGKNFGEIDEERSRLGNIAKTDRYQDINAISSPISYLYERFNRLEQSKRKVAILEDEEARRGVLKELFEIYIRHDIIKLSDGEFERFIDYCNFSDEFVKSATDYELVMAVKRRYEEFERMGDYVKQDKK
jgi:hypothetical protein